MARDDRTNTHTPSGGGGFHRIQETGHAEPNTPQVPATAARIAQLHSAHHGAYAHGRHGNNNSDGSGHAADTKAQDNNGDGGVAIYSYPFLSLRQQLHLPAQVLQATTTQADATDMETPAEQTTATPGHDIAAAVPPLAVTLMPTGWTAMTTTPRGPRQATQWTTEHLAATPTSI